LRKVANRDDLGVFVGEESIQDLIAAITQRNKAEANPLISAQDAVATKGRGHACCRCDLRKVSSCQFVHMPSSVRKRRPFET
jgi:hypothetical protein